MPVAGTLAIDDLRKMFKEGGEDAVKEYYNGNSFFLLVLSDGFSTHVTWTPPGTDTEEFMYTPSTPPDGNETLDSEDLVADLLNDSPKTTKRVQRAYFSPTEGEEDVYDPASLIVPLSDNVEIISVGRGGFNDVKLTSTSISSIHASFIKAADKKAWGLMDRGSKNGTRLDGVAMDANNLCSLVAPGREVAFADIRCILLDIWGLIDVCSV